MSRSLPIALLFAMLGATTASATTVDPLVALKDFNAVIFDNASTASDIEGAAVIGGNFSGATVYNHPVGQPLTGYGALTVFGSTSGNPINLDNGGSAYVEGSKGAILNFNGGGGYLSAPPNDINDFSTAFTSFSASLAQLAETSTLPQTGNNEEIKATPNSQGVAVFDITAAELDSIPSFKINLGSATSVIFNVSGSSINLNANDESGDAGADNIIWNFYQATNVAFGTQIGGSVLAPLAQVTNQNQIDGALVAKSWIGTGELHDYSYTGGQPITPPPASATPEPAAWVLLIGGVAGIGLALRRANAAVRRDLEFGLAA